MLRAIRSSIAQNINRLEAAKIYCYSCDLYSESIDLAIYPLNKPSTYTSSTLIKGDISHNLCLSINQSICDATVIMQQEIGLIFTIFNPDTNNEHFEYLPSFITHNLLYIEIDIHVINPCIDKPNLFEDDLIPPETDVKLYNLTTEMLFNEVYISKNLFSPICFCKTDGKSYIEVKQIQGESHDSEKKPNKTDRTRKAYIRIKTRKSEHIIRKNVWDLLYPLLLPPLKYDFNNQIEFFQELYPFQKDGVNFLFNHESALLADQMGTGKTVQTIVALRFLFRTGKIKNALVLCPVAIIGSAQLSQLTGKPEGWDGHFHFWAPELIVTVVRGTQEVREIDWHSPAHIYISTYDTLRNDLQNGLIKKDLFEYFNCVILDEAQNIKNAQSGRAKSVKKLKADWRWALTGTPIENKVEDIISIFSYIKPDVFKSNKEYNPNQVKEKIAPYFLRRLKKDVLKDLPEKIRQEVWLELDGDQKTFYDNELDKGRIELQTKLETDGEIRIRTHIFALMTKLKRICNFAPEKITSPKTEALHELLETIKANDDKVIIFSQFIDFGIDKLKIFLSKQGIEYCSYTGDLSDRERNKTIEKFRGEKSVTVLLASVRAAGIGLTLTEASYVIHFDHWWNPATMWQAEDRTHRPGQTKNVNVISFWMQNTIEERIKQKLREKGLLIENVIDSLATSESEIESIMTTKEWLEIFDIKTIPGKYSSSSSTSIENIMIKLKSVSPQEFENITKEYFVKIGYQNAKVTQKSYDGGIDVYGSRLKDSELETIVAQCKRTELVGVKVARELMGVVASSKSVDKGYIITSGTFTSECTDFANSTNKIILMDGLLFAKRLNELGLIK